MTERRLRQMLKTHEGFRSKPYFDCCGKFFRDCRCEKQGKLHIGWGQNIESVGVNEMEANFMLSNRIAEVLQECTNAFTWFNYLSVPRQDVVADMVYNLGLPTFRGFKRMIAALRVQNYPLAAKEMLDSRWARRLVSRSSYLERIMRTGEHPE